MTRLEASLRNAERLIDHSNDPSVASDVFDILRVLAGEVEELTDELQSVRELIGLPLATPEPAMSRVDALKLAREHVEAMATNARGYQDGVKLDDKVRAMERFARFLMGEESE